jgi:hypothetical protein
MASRAADRITVPGGLDNPSDFILVALQVHWVCPLKVVSLEYGFKPDGGLKMPRKRHKAEEIVAKLRGLRSEGKILDYGGDWLANFFGESMQLRPRISSR